MNNIFLEEEIRDMIAELSLSIKNNKQKINHFTVLIHPDFAKSIFTDYDYRYLSFLPAIELTVEKMILGVNCKISTSVDRMGILYEVKN